MGFYQILFYEQWVSIGVRPGGRLGGDDQKDNLGRRGFGMLVVVGVLALLLGTVTSIRQSITKVVVFFSLLKGD